jgi:predicted HTH transcriptional regulator
MPNYIIYIFIGTVGILIGMSLAKNRTAKSGSQISSAREKASEAIQERNAERKNKILDLAKQKGKIANNDVEEMLGVSDATARNYLDDLEKDGKLKQIGHDGRGVHYTLK